MRASLLRGLLQLIALLPLPALQFAGRIIGWINDVFGTRSARVTEANLKLCLPDLDPQAIAELRRKSLAHTGQTLMETPAVWLGSIKRSESWLGRVENEQLLENAINARQGLVILLPHLGNWEMFNIYFRGKAKMTALYQPPRQDWLKNLMQVIRNRPGNELVATNVKGIARLYKNLAAGEVVTILPDQIPQSGEYVPFFGQLALTDRLVPRLLQKTQSIALTCIVYRSQGKFNIRFSEVDPNLYQSDPLIALTALNCSIEKAISQHLAQYQWEYKRFRERPAGEKKIYKFSSEENIYHQ